jgi:hypothetical protein
MEEEGTMRFMTKDHVEILNKKEQATLSDGYY